MMIERFREATKQLHRDIEKENAAAKIIDHSITLEEYKLLLLQNYIAYKITEEEIGKYLSGETAPKHERLKKDLDHLRVDTAVSSQFENSFFCNSYAEAMGAAYVVEGSTLGGMLIAKELKQCENLHLQDDPQFFNGDRKNIKSWNAFKKQLDTNSFTDEEAKAATEKAKETFQFFGQVFRLTQAEVEL